MVLWRLLLSHPSVDPYKEDYEAFNAMRRLCRQSYLELKAAVPPFNLYGLGPCLKYTNDFTRDFVYHMAADILLRRSTKEDDVLQVKRIVSLIGPTGTIYYHCCSVQMLDYALEVLPGEFKEWSSHIMHTAAARNDIAMMRRVRAIAPHGYEYDLLRFCTNLNTIKVAVEELGAAPYVDYIMRRGDTLDLYKYAKSKGATNYDDMLYNAAKAKNIRLCRLAKKWGATSFDHAMGLNTSVPIYKALKSWGGTDFHRMMRMSGYHGNRDAFNLARKWGKFSWPEIFGTAHKHGIPRLAMWVLDSVGLSIPAILDKFEFVADVPDMWCVCERMYEMSDCKTRRRLVQQIWDAHQYLALWLVNRERYLTKREKSAIKRLS